MKILAFGDLHGNYLKVLDYLNNNNLDLIIITGDITNFGPAELGEEILNEIKLTKEVIVEEDEDEIGGDHKPDKMKIDDLMKGMEIMDGMDGMDGVLSGQSPGL